MASGQLTSMLDDQIAIASRLAPTGILVKRGNCDSPETLWEPGLPAKASAQTKSYSNVPALSRASPAPARKSRAKDRSLPQLLQFYCGVFSGSVLNCEKLISIIS